MPDLSAGPERRPRPDFEAQHRADRDCAIFNSRVLRHCEVPDYSILSARELAMLAAAYTVEAIACELMAQRIALARRSGLPRALWRDRWEGLAVTARLAAHCCDARLKWLGGRR